jgi:hypothetical protein
VPVPSQETIMSCICVLLGVSNLTLSTIALIDFGIVPTVWYFVFFIISQNHGTSQLFPLPASTLRGTLQYTRTCH